MNHELVESINTAKRCCNRCHIQKTFKENDIEKELAQKACKRCIDLFREEFDIRRRNEQTTNEQIETLKTAKIICLDALDSCKACDRSTPRMKNILVKLRD